jgi:hypothetical protein
MCLKIDSEVIKNLSIQDLGGRTHRRILVLARFLFADFPVMTSFGDMSPYCQWIILAFMNKHTSQSYYRQYSTPFLSIFHRFVNLPLVHTVLTIPNCC